LGRERGILPWERLFYRDFVDFGPLNFDIVSDRYEKLYKINKKIIALNGFDDYYNKFACKDLY